MLIPRGKTPTLRFGSLFQEIQDVREEISSERENQSIGVFSDQDLDEAEVSRASIYEKPPPSTEELIESTLKQTIKLKLQMDS